MEELFQELERAKKKEEEEIQNIKYVLNKNKNKKQEPQFKKLVYEIRSKDEMYEEMKKKFRLQWKGTGYSNKEFSQPPVLKPARLSQWELFKAVQPERNFYYPKGYRGFKTKYCGTEFGIPDTSLYPILFRTHLEKTQEKFNHFLMRPSKYGKLKLDEQIDKLDLMNKEPFRMINTVQNSDFNWDKHKTWEAEIKNRKGRRF